MENDTDYPALFAAAKAQAVQAWEDEAVSRAVDGVFEPNTFKGQFVYPVTQRKDPKTGKTRSVKGKVPLGVWKKSDRLLEFLLRGAKPETYRQTSFELKGEVKTEYKFDGSITELADLYRRTTMPKQDGEES